MTQWLFEKLYAAITARVAALELRGKAITVTATFTSAIAAAPSGSYSSTVAVPGATVGQAVVINPKNSNATGIAWCTIRAYVSGTDEVTYSVFNPTALALTSSTFTFTVTVLQ